MILSPAAVLALGLISGALAIPQSPAAVSADGACGQINGKPVTCKGSVFGSCCSAYGYCGPSTDYCGTGCQSAFGTCGSSSTPSSTAKPSAQATTSAPGTGAAKPAIYRGACGDKAKQVASNPGFENGLAGWTAGGGAKLTAYTAATSYPWQAAAGGKSYVYLEASDANPTSSVTQNVYDLGGSNTGAVTISYDWAFMVTVRGRGPPSAACSMVVSWGMYSVVSSWTRPAASGGEGREMATLRTGGGLGDLKITFSCSSTTNIVATAVLDNVEVQAC
ncbi:hypothetical protein RB594_000084 [Gaeumannomyces avenae]